MPTGNNKLRTLIESALLEDIGMGDVTTDAIVPPNLTATAEIRVKEDGIIAGLAVIDEIFQVVDQGVNIDLMCEDGRPVKASSIVGIINGSCGSILKSERTLLNILQRMSGIATLTHAFVESVAGTNAKITDTRKTAPGLRLLDKMAVRLGGGVNHRFGLDDMILIKDNHITAAGSITEAIRRCKKYIAKMKNPLKIEVETKNLAEVEEVLRIGTIDRIMLDNFSLDDIKKAVILINRAVQIEASGNITLANVRAIAETGVDYISVGALTHSPRALDISLKITPKLSI